MAMKIKGITIELSADTTGLEKALKGINKSLSDTQKDLKEVDKALKLDPKNLELIEQKQRLLAKATEETTEKLKALKRAQESIDTGSDSGQRQYDTLTREISATEKKLQGLNSEQNRFNQEAANAQFQSTGFGAALTKVSEGANKVAQNTAAMSAAAGVALGGLVAMTAQASAFADEMLTASQQTGLSTDTLQEMSYAAERVDVPLETIIGAIRKMKGHLDESSGVWDKLGVQVRDQTGNYRDIEDIFYDTVGALSEIENGTERDTMAMEVFGRSADEMAGILDDGGQKLRALGDEARSIGGIIPEEDLESLGEFNDKLEEMKSKLAVLALQAAVPLAEALMPGLEALANVITSVANAVSHLNPQVVRMGVVFLGILAAVSPIAKMIANITQGFLGLVQIVPYVKAGMLAIQESFTAFTSNPYTLIILAICAALALLAVAIYEVVDNWDTIGPAAEEALGNMGDSISAANDKIIDFASSIKDNVANGFSRAADGISTFLGRVGEVTGITKAIEGIGDAFGKMAESIGEAISDALSLFDDLINGAKDAGVSVIDAFVSGVKSVIANVEEAFRQLGEAIASVWDAITGNAKQAGQQTATAYANGVQSGPTPRIQQPIYTPQNPYANSYGSTTNSLNSLGSGELLSAVNMLNQNIQSMNNGPTNVNVELVGSAKNIFDTVRVQNSKLQTATGYHALA